MEETGATKFAGWAILELMGHRRLAGYVQEAELAGCGMLRIDIPSDPPATQFYSAGALYALTPCTEATARAVACLSKVAPVELWELPAPKTLSTYAGDPADAYDEREAEKERDRQEHVDDPI